MKKQILLLGLPLLMLASCSKDEPKDTVFTYDLKMAQLISKPGAQPELGSAQYIVVFNMSKSTMALTGKDVLVADTKYNFTTDASPILKTMDFTIQGENGVRSLYTFKTPDTKVDNGTAEVDDARCMLTNGFFNPSLSNYGIAYTAPTLYLGIRYEIDDYSITTFFNDILYRGETKTSYRGSDGEEVSFSSSDPVYRLKIDLDTQKATLALYNAKFASEMPRSINMLLQNLDVELTAGKITVSGTDVVPQVVEGDGLTPYENYTFGSIRFTTTNPWLTQVKCEYTVAGRFNGSFEGSFLPDAIQPGELFQ